MRRIRVLIVDDSAVVRRIVADILTSDPAFEVVGVAANGRIALARIPQVNPDVVVLDVEMPEMDGLQTLAAVRKASPRLPVVMFSTLTHRGAAATIDALSLGASDYAPKPSCVRSGAEGVQAVRDHLVPKLKALGAKAVRGAQCAVRGAGDSIAEAARLTAVPTAQCAPRTAHASPASIVAIGVSTGGPSALERLLSRLPPGFPAPILIVQHMPPLFTQLLAARLDARCALPVREGTSGAVPEPGSVWLAPGDRHMIVESLSGDRRLRTHLGPPENSCRPAVDVLFRSVAQVYGAQTLAVVLTGMGQDGLRGSEWVREVGGQILVQDEATSVIWSMPGSVARRGLAHQVLPLDDIAGAIMRRVAPGTPAPRVASGREGTIQRWR